MYMKDEKIVEIDDYRLELENRIRNLLWTISGDYTLNMKVDVSLYLRSKAIALYDGIKQGALAKYYDRNLLGLYLVKKVFCQAGERRTDCSSTAMCRRSNRGQNLSGASGSPGDAEGSIRGYPGSGV